MTQKAPRPGSKTEKIIEEYDRLIDNGCQINQMEISRKLKVGRTTVQKALQRWRPDYAKHLRFSRVDVAKKFTDSLRHWKKTSKKSK